MRKAFVNNEKCAWISGLLLICFVLINSAVADGKLLRGEKWQRFAVEDNTADFYVSSVGNDDWSGTLASPNADRTDGPFATLQRAQKAVRQSKKQFYKPNDPPIDARFIGSPHTLGSGKDILVLVRGGRYYLSEPLMFSPEDGGERVETNLPTGAFEYHKLRDHYVTWAAFPGEQPVIVGGEPVNGWQVKKGTWTAVVDGPVESFVVNGRLQTLARTPNSGFFTPPKLSTNARELYFRPGELRAWDDLQDSRVTML
ncbi:MAG: hypothetical protein D6800_13540, partial [Candidatus Zixiibacteriota bacterium]